MSEPNPKLLEMYDRLYQQELALQAKIRMDEKAACQRRMNDTAELLRPFGWVRENG